MSVKPIVARVLPILCDPETRTSLSLDSDRFVGGSRPFPVVNDVPRFVASDDYVGSFSFEWNVHWNTQLDPHRTDALSETEFQAKTGFTPDQLRGRLVLDAGVGAGRYAEVVSRWGGDVVGVDLSYAVEAAQRNLADRPNVWIAQADIGALPFKPGSFDFIFSIGVLHHTPDARAYFRKLIPLLKPGGEIAIWVYPRQGDYIVRERWVRFVNKIPMRMYYAWCSWFLPWAVQRLDHPLVAASRHIFPFTTHGRDIEYHILDTFDGFSPRYHSLHTPKRVMRWFRNAGLVDVRAFAWETAVRGKRPLPE